MFVRKKKNRSGTVSVVIADKSSGKFKELKTIGVSSDPDEIARLEVKARQWINEYSGQLTLDFDENAQALQEIPSRASRERFTTRLKSFSAVYTTTLASGQSGTAFCVTLLSRGSVIRRVRSRR